jgi:cytochrome c-type biogenesis protein CcmH
MIRYFLPVLFLVLWSGTAHAVQPDEMLKDPVLEARARVISKELRCLVCQNQSIDDSDADLAHDLRMLVRERLKAGDSNDAVIQYIVQRYGDYVLLKPPVNSETAALWLGPGFFLIIALISAAVFFRRRDLPAATLSDQDHQRVEAILRNHSQNGSP